MFYKRVINVAAKRPGFYAYSKKKLAQQHSRNKVRKSIVAALGLVWCSCCAGAGAGG